MTHPRGSQSRGQALVEIALMLPALLITVGMLFWAVRNAVMLERMQTALRYQGEIADQGSAPLYLTFNDIYYAAQGLPDPAYQASFSCSGPATALLARTGSDSLNGVSLPRSAFWLAPDANATCTDTELGYSGNGLSRDLLVDAQTVQAQTIGPPVNSNVVTALFSQFVPLLPTQMTFFRQPSLHSTISCFPEIVSALKATLIDAQNPATDPTPMFVATNANWSIAPPTNPLQMSKSCQSSAPANFVPTFPAAAPQVGAGAPGDPSRGSGNIGDGSGNLGGSGPAYL